MWPFKKICEHYDTKHEFKDLHRGGDGELYFRHYTVCQKCGKRWCSAPRIPDNVAQVLNDGLWPRLSAVHKKTQDEQCQSST
jgi:hypothetical protein